MTLKSALSKVASTLALTFALNTAQADTREQPKIEIDPKHPIASLCAAGQQFTVVRDTQHGKPEILGMVLRDLEKCAHAGVKNIILEPSILSWSRLEGRFPDLKGKSPKEKEDLLHEKRKILYNGIFEASGLKTPDSGEEIPYDHEKVIQYLSENPDIEDKRYELDLSSSSITINQLMDRWYGYDESIGKVDILNHYNFFASGHADSEEDYINTGIIKAQIIMESRALGMRVHFAGDFEGVGYLHTSEYYVDKASKALQERGLYMQETPLRKSVYEYRLTGKKSDHFLNNPIEKIEEESENITNFIRLNHKKFSQAAARATESYEHWMSIRMSAKSEQERADRFANLANGEPSILVWGAGHFENENLDRDLNERLDASLKKRNPSNYKPVKEIALHVSKEHYASDTSRVDPTSKYAPTDNPHVRFFIESQDVEIPPEYQNQYSIKKQESDNVIIDSTTLSH